MSEERKEAEQNKDDENVVDFDAFINAIRESIKDGKLLEIIESFNKVKVEKIKNQKSLNNTNLSFWKMRFIKDIVITIVLIGAIVILSLENVINDSIVGTLLASVIGYSIGNGSFKNKKD